MTSEITSTIISTPFELHCRESEISPPEDVHLQTWGFLEEERLSTDILIVDLLLHPIAKEEPSFTPDDEATPTGVVRLEEILIPYLKSGGVLIVLTYERIQIKDTTTEDVIYRDSHEWFESIIPVKIKKGLEKSADRRSLNSQIEPYFNYIESVDHTLNTDDIRRSHIDILAKNEEYDPVGIAIDHFQDRDESWPGLEGQILFLPRPSTLRYDFRGMIQSLVAIGVSNLPSERKEQIQAEHHSQPDSGSVVFSPEDQLEQIFSRFNIAARQLEERYNDRETLEINDEYDVQDLLHALLQLFFDDIREEEWSPSYAGTSPRIDFLLKEESIGIEVKMARSNHGQKAIKEELAIDKDHYRSIPNCDTLICFVYDPAHVINNPIGFERDISEKTSNLETKVFIAPKAT